MKIIFFILLSTLFVSACDRDEEQLGDVTYDVASDMECVRHLYGLDTQQDIEKAIPFCKKAAESGAAGSQNVMGMIYLETDKEKAIYWLKKSAYNGHTGAIEQLEIMGIH